MAGHLVGYGSSQSIGIDTLALRCLLWDEQRIFRLDGTAVVPPGLTGLILNLLLMGQHLLQERLGISMNSKVGMNTALLHLVLIDLNHHMLGITEETVEIIACGQQIQTGTDG